MRTASTVISWIGGILSIIVLAIFLSRGIQVYDRWGYRTEPFPAWVWIIFVIYIFVDIAVLIWRETQLEKGHKIACGILTLIFSSKLGGIFTLCIPEEQIYVRRYRPRTSYSSSTFSTHTGEELSPLERAAKIKEYDEMYEQGKLTMYEYNKKVALLDGREFDTQKEEPVKNTFDEEEESKKLGIIRQYKELLDEGIITEEEFNLKKAAILRK